MRNVRLITTEAYVFECRVINEGAEKSKPPAVSFFIKAESFSEKTQREKLYESMTRHEKINSEDNTKL